MEIATGARETLINTQTRYAQVCSRLKTGKKETCIRAGNVAVTTTTAVEFHFNPDPSKPDWVV